MKLIILLAILAIVYAWKWREAGQMSKAAGTIRDALDKGRSLRISVHDEQQARLLKKVVDYHANKYGGNPTLVAIHVVSIGQKKQFPIGSVLS